MNTFEDALKKLDHIEDNLNEQAEEIRQKDQEIEEKDNRNAQLHKLFQGTAVLFQKQHNYVDKLKKQLEKESKDKSLSQEQVQHLQKDVKLFTDWKDELLVKLNELEDAKNESEKARDKEIADLKQKIRELTEVKMKRQESEERLKKQSEEFENVMKMNQLVYDILGEFSQQTGLLLRSQEVVKKLKEITSQLQKEQGWWDKWIEDRYDKNYSSYSSYSSYLTYKKMYQILTTEEINSQKFDFRNITFRVVTGGAHKYPYLGLSITTNEILFLTGSIDDKIFRENEYGNFQQEGKENIKTFKLFFKEKVREYYKNQV